MKNLAIAKRESISKKNHMAQIVRFHEIGGAEGSPSFYWTISF